LIRLKLTGAEMETIRDKVAWEPQPSKEFPPDDAWKVEAG
jgi:hypothetical protein